MGEGALGRHNGPLRSLFVVTRLGAVTRHPRGRVPKRQQTQGAWPDCRRLLARVGPRDSRNTSLTRGPPYCGRWHQTRQPRPGRSRRTALTLEISAIRYRSFQSRFVDADNRAEAGAPTPYLGIRWGIPRTRDSPSPVVPKSARTQSEAARVQPRLSGSQSRLADHIRADVGTRQ